MSLNRHALLLCLLELVEHLLRLVDPVRLAFDLHPAFARGDFHAERVLHVFQELEIVGIERLQLARVFEMQRAAFCHPGGNRKIDICRLAEAVNQRPMGAFFG